MNDTSNRINNLIGVLRMKNSSHAIDSKTALYIMQEAISIFSKFASETDMITIARQIETYRKRGNTK